MQIALVPQALRDECPLHHWYSRTAQLENFLVRDEFYRLSPESRVLDLGLLWDCRSALLPNFQLLKWTL
ncbi:hypothetical protein D3C81_2101520 [compost metagenome]